MSSENERERPQSHNAAAASASVCSSPPHTSRHISSGQENNLREPMISYGLWHKSKDVCFSGNNSTGFSLLKRIINLSSDVYSSHHLLNQNFPVTKLACIFQGHQEVCLSAELGHNMPPLWQTRLPHGVRQPRAKGGQQTQSTSLALPFSVEFVLYD